MHGIRYECNFEPLRGSPSKRWDRNPVISWMEVGCDAAQFLLEESITKFGKVDQMNVEIGHRIRSKILSFSTHYQTPEIGTISDICFTVEPAANSLLGDTTDHVRFNRIEEGELTQIHSLLQSAIRQWPIDSLFPLLDLLSSRIQRFSLLISLLSNHSIGIHRNASASSLHL